MKKVISAFLALVLIVVASVVWFYQSAKPVSDQENYQDFLITKGSSAMQVGNNLKSQGFIRNALAYKIYIQFTGKSGNIQAGEYRITPSSNLFEIISAFSEGPIELWVTVPEGLRREEVALKFAKGLGQGDVFVSEFMTASSGKEGTLFPDTYLFPREASASSVVNKMTQTFDTKTQGLTSTSGLSFSDTLVLASLLERETVTDEERPVVAGILIKRLNAGWPLQVDAAVQYGVASSRFAGKSISGITDWWPEILRADLELNSPYNTYKFQGFPPGPIASPGLSSIKAAFNPTESEYWYYIHDPDGKIHYGRTLEEHNANVARYLGK